VVAVSIGVRLIEGGMTYAPALFVLILTPEFYLPFRQFGAERHAAMDAVASGRDLVEGPEDVRVEAARPSVASAEFDPPSTLRFDRVTYTYPGRESPALREVSLTLDSGRTHVLAGPSGAGKSTLMKLLLRQIEPDAGTVFMDGLPLKEIPREAWRRQVTWISQKPFFVHGTVADNLRVACPGVARADLLAAFDRAGLRDWVEGLPYGLDTRIGEDGLQFSGGQRQRIALTRAFLRPAPYLLLDEPESGLDPESERDMAVAVGRLAEGRTVLIIAHRRHTLRRADQVIWLADGRVVEVGPPDAVLARREGSAS
jgi:ATP-binding cassette subfamily C protein CydD